MQARRGRDEGCRATYQGEDGLPGLLVSSARYVISLETNGNNIICRIKHVIVMHAPHCIYFRERQV